MENPKPQMKTSSEFLQLEKMQKCTCAMQLEVIYICMDQECPNKEKQPLYCVKCNKKNHIHHGQLIAEKLEEFKDQWNDLRADIETKFNAISKSFEVHEPLIQYIESALLASANFDKSIVWISTQYLILKQLQENFELFYQKTF